MAIVIAGAGQAGAQTAESLRKEGYSGKIIIVGDEPFPPYQRPPLSKGYLSGELELDRLWFRPQSFYSKWDISLHSGLCVQKIDRAQRRVLLSDGEYLSYDRLVIATGMSAGNLQISGANKEGAFTLRTIDDIDRLRPFFNKKGNLAIIGGGWIGLEAAAVACSSGIDTTLIHRSERPLSRVASLPLSNFFAEYHRRKGVNLLTNARIIALVGKSKIEAVQITSGSESEKQMIKADALLVGIGGISNMQIAETAGLQCSDGVITDKFCQTSDQYIYAVGDVASIPTSRYGRIRLESVQNALDSAKICAANIMGKSTIYDPVPWFWSEQYDLHLQSAGIVGNPDITVHRKEDDTPSFSLWHYHQQKLIAVEAINSPKAYMLGRRLIGQNKSPDPQLVSNPKISIQEINLKASS